MHQSHASLHAVKDSPEAISFDMFGYRDALHSRSKHPKILALARELRKQQIAFSYQSKNTIHVNATGTQLQGWQPKSIPYRPSFTISISRTYIPQCPWHIEHYHVRQAFTSTSFSIMAAGTTGLIQKLVRFNILEATPTMP
jgi:hypothetical protein